ncbi:hypothetical protein BH23ACI1_BH23ACI1_21380 [soil metagenome]
MQNPTLSDKIDALSATFLARFDAVDRRFDAVDRRFDAVDQRFDELKAELRTEIEAVDTKVDLVLEKIGHLMSRDISNAAAHASFDQRLENHDLRIRAIESSADHRGKA